MLSNEGYFDFTKGNDVTNAIIDLDRYEELLDLETRVNVVCQMVYRNSSFGKKEILSILGTDLAMKAVEKIEEEDKKFYDSIKSEVCLVEELE